MGDTTAISWCDATFNGWIGCTEVSVGEKGACVGCYARELAARYGMAEWGNHPRHRTSAANWRKPLIWNRKAERDGTRPFVFCSSLADVFDNQVPPEWRRDLFDLIRATPHLTWLLLTKRPQNIVKLFCDTFIGFGRSTAWPTNAAIGCTVVTQEEADRDIPRLLAALHALNPPFVFISDEPAQGFIRLPLGFLALGGRAWAIWGGETDQGKHKARAPHPDWARVMRDDCALAGVPFHLKQWGEWIDADQPGVDMLGTESSPLHNWQDGHYSVRIGKKAAGRLLDGVEHNARPSLTREAAPR